MRVKIISAFAIAFLLMVSLSSASMIIPSNDNARENAKAPEKSPVIGANWDLVRVDFVHYARSSAPGTKTDACYKLLGVKWTTLPVIYYINPINPDSLTEEFVSSAVSTAAETWDDKTSIELFNSYNIDYSAQYGVQNYKNEIAFGEYSDSNAIAVTSIWYTRIGKRIVEFDIIFSTKFNWGDASADSSLMDLQNIATHEFGHSAGMADIYSSSCSGVTMYGYSNYGDISKRTLEQPDIFGLQKMYGI